MLEIINITLTPFYQNSRIVADTSAGVAAVVDPGGEVAKILGKLQELSLSCEQIWLTHSHLDHCGGAAALKKKTGAMLFAHRADAFLRAKVSEDAAAFGLDAHEFEACPEPDKYIDEGDILRVGAYEFKVLHTPGHSPGHVAFLNVAEGIVISGDSLFGGAIGRVSLPGGNAEILLKSIREKLLTLPEETAVLCGHGGDTSIGTELRTNPFLLAPADLA